MIAPASIASLEAFGVPALYDVPFPPSSDSTPLEWFFDPVRAFLGDHDESIHMFEDASIERVVRSLVLCGEAKGYSLSPDRRAIVPAVASPKVFGILTYKACLAFAAPTSGGYSWRTRAMSRSFGNGKAFLQTLENALYQLENGNMFSCWLNFYSWLNAITGVHVWSHMTDMKVEAPVGTVAIGVAGLRVTGK